MEMIDIWAAENLKNNENCLFRPYLRQTQILILEILNVFLRLKLSSSLIWTKNPSFRSDTK